MIDDMCAFKVVVFGAKTGQIHKKKELMNFVFKIFEFFFIK